MNCEYSRQYGCMVDYTAGRMLDINNEELELKARMSAPGLSAEAKSALAAEWHGFIERRGKVEQLFGQYRTPCKNCDILLE